MAKVAKNGVVKLEYSIDDGTTWLNLNGTTSFDPGTTTAESLDGTDYDSTGNQREYVNGYKAASDGSIVVNFDEADAGHTQMRTSAGGAAIKLRHQFDTKYLVMPTLVKSMTNPAEVGQILKSTITIQAAAAPTWEDVA